MDDISNLAFASLFKEACLKCFSHALQQPLTETESKLFYNELFEQTGLVVGWKSLKNYSFFVLNEQTAKPENPSAATLDTLARYVLNIPYTTETERKNKENHYPYWFQYKEQFYKTGTTQHEKRIPKRMIFLLMIIVIIVAAVFILFSTQKIKAPVNFSDNFLAVSNDSLQTHGWFLKSKDSAYWNKRNETANVLSLFTLEGDTWPDSVHQPLIKNLLLHKITDDCFTAEVRLQNFFPREEWQQAGILLLEDTNLTGKSLRLSIAYNDFFGGFSKPKEVIIQAITASGNGLSQPEEIAHVPVFTLDSGKEMLVANNLKYSGLRIEKKGDEFRLLYSCSPEKNFAFKEAASATFNFHPKYIGIFALKGFVKDTSCIAAEFSNFTIAANACK